VAGAGGGLGQATATLAAGGLTMMAVDRNEQALRELPVGVRREVADTTDPAAAKGLIDRVAGEVGADVPVNTNGLPWCAHIGTLSSAIQGGGKAGRNQHVHACPWSIGSAVLWPRVSP